MPSPLPPRYDNRPDQLALDDVNLVLQPGRLTALVGLSGSGKTTLVSLLQRHYDPTGGQVLVDGSDLREVRGAEGGGAWVPGLCATCMSTPHAALNSTCCTGKHMLACARPMWRCNACTNYQRPHA